MVGNTPRKIHGLGPDPDSEVLDGTSTELRSPLLFSLRHSGLGLPVNEVSGVQETTQGPLLRYPTLSSIEPS